MSVWRGCEIPEDLWYDIEHGVWVRLEDNGEVTVGMTDPSQTRCGMLVHLQIKKVGRRLAKGKSVATVESAKWVGPFTAPVTGEIVATNQAGFDADIRIANKDPYGRGWIARLRPEDWEAEVTQLITGEAAVEKYKKRIEEIGVNCMRCAE